MSRSEPLPEVCQLDPVVPKRCNGWVAIPFVKGACIVRAPWPMRMGSVDVAYPDASTWIGKRGKLLGLTTKENIAAWAKRCAKKPGRIGDASQVFDHRLVMLGLKHLPDGPIKVSAIRVKNWNMDTVAFESRGIRLHVAALNDRFFQPNGQPQLKLSDYSGLRKGESDG